MKDYISYKEIISRIDINDGDIVIVSSDIVRFMCVCRDNKEQFNPNIFIDSIIEKIGDKGTLLFPTYNWDYCKGKSFDYYNTISQTGSLSNIALKRKDFIRTKHPIYSHAVTGFDSKYLYNLNNKSAFGPDSVFAYLYKNKAKQLFIGDKESFWHRKAYTSLHYIEEKVGVDYRYIKFFSAPYINETRIKKDSTYSMSVRDLNHKDCDGNEVGTEVAPTVTSLLIEKDYYKKYIINENYFILIDMYGLGKILEDDFKANGQYIICNNKSDHGDSRIPLASTRLGSKMMSIPIEQTKPLVKDLS